MQNLWKVAPWLVVVAVAYLCPNDSDVTIVTAMLAFGATVVPPSFK